MPGTGAGSESSNIDSKHLRFLALEIMSVLVVGTRIRSSIQCLDPQDCQAGKLHYHGTS